MSTGSEVAGDGDDVVDGVAARLGARRGPRRLARGGGESEGDVLASQTLKQDDEEHRFGDRRPFLGVPSLGQQAVQEGP